MLSQGFLSEEGDEILWSSLGERIVRTSLLNSSSFRVMVVSGEGSMNH